MLVLLFVALRFILRGDLFYVVPCVILFLCFSVILALRLHRLGKRERANLSVFYVCLTDLCLFGFVGFIFLLVLGKAAVCDCGTPLTFLLPFFQVFFLLFHSRGFESISLQIQGTLSSLHLSKVTNLFIIWPTINVSNPDTTIQCCFSL